MEQLNGCNGHVFQHRHIGKQIEMLEHHAHLLPVHIDIDLGICNIHAIHQNLTGSGNLQQIQGTEQCRLAAAAGSDDDNHLALINLQ